MCADKQTDWTVVTIVVSLLIVFLSMIGSDMYISVKRSADQEVFLSNCVKSHNPTDCAVAYKATR